MFNKILTTFLIGGAMTAVIAGESDWKMSLGTTFRSFKKSELKSLSFGSDKYVNGSYENGTVTVDDSGHQVVPYPGGLPGSSHLASLHSVSFGSSSSDLEDTAGLVLQWTKGLQTSTINKVGGVDWEMDISLVWVGVDQAFGSTGDVDGDTFDVDVSDFPNGVIEDVENGVPGDDSSLLPPSDTVEGFARYDLDIDAFTIGFGIGPRFEMGPVDLKLSVGPTVTVVNYNTKVDGEWNFRGEAVSGDTISRSDDGVDSRWGLYGSLGLIYDFNRNWGMEVGFRYDYIPDSIDTNVVNIDLSGMSTEVKLVYSF